MSEDVQRSEHPVIATQDPLVTIVVPTFRRSQWLRANLHTCLAQEGLRSPVLIRYLHETRPGISHARNTGMAQARRRTTIGEVSKVG